MNGLLTVTYPDTLPIGLFLSMCDHIIEDIIGAFPDESTWPDWTSTRAEWEEVSKGDADAVAAYIASDKALRRHKVACTWISYEDMAAGYDGSGDRWHSG